MTETTPPGIEASLPRGRQTSVDSGPTRAHGAIDPARFPQCLNGTWSLRD
jgi:hypothetical protein